MKIIDYILCLIKLIINYIFILKIIAFVNIHIIIFFVYLHSRFKRPIINFKIWQNEIKSQRKQKELIKEIISNRD